MELLIKKSAMQVNGQIASFPAFAHTDFIGIEKGRKANWPKCIFKNNGVKMVTPFNATEYAAANQGSQKDVDAETVSITFPNSLYAEEGDRTPRPFIPAEVAQP